MNTKTQTSIGLYSKNQSTQKPSTRYILTAILSATASARWLSPRVGALSWPTLANDVGRISEATQCQAYLLLFERQTTSVYVTNNSGQLSLLPSAARETSTCQNAARKCGWKVKAGMAGSIFNVWVAGRLKLCDARFTRAIPERLTDELSRYIALNKCPRCSLYFYSRQDNWTCGAENTICHRAIQFHEVFTVERKVNCPFLFAQRVTVTALG